MTRLARAFVAALLLTALTAVAALAHPLGNFTINHYAGIRVEPNRIALDVVIDEAEIPAFQATQALDTDGDGRISDRELAVLVQPRCLEVGRSLVLAVDGTRASLTLTAAGATLPPGNGGLSTLRLVCGFTAPASIAAPSRVALRDDFESARIGWREMTVVGSGVTVATPGVAATSTSTRLTAYPTSLASAPDVRELAFDVRPGGPVLPDLPAPDAAPVEPVTVDGSGSGPAVGETVTGPQPTAPTAVAAPGPGAAPVAAAVPGGAEALPDVLRQAPMSPLLAIGALLVAAALGAGHAITPGHGKTLMAAYLVGTRGTARQALGLGLTVSVTHTAGILALAIAILAAESAFAPDVVVRIAPVVAAGSIVVVGAWMLVAELRRRRASRDHERAHEHEHTHGQEFGHEHGHDHPHGHDAAPDHGHEHAADPLEHRHGPIRHSHAPSPDRQGLNWRGLALLGLAGGLVPSANALLILLGTIAAGRPAWGVVLVGAFGLGMAAVMAGIGLAVVTARGALDRVPRELPLATARRFVPLGASVLVLTIGIVLSVQALGAAGLA